jgi:AcrR family transcriptional regulator
METLVEQKLTFPTTLALVKSKRKPESSRRRKPAQERARVTVEAILDAAVKVLKREGASSITTNRIAHAAGVSIGSVYQYFPDKQAIFVALHERHIHQVERTIRERVRQCAGASLETLIGSLVEGMIEIHNLDPELSMLLQSEVPHRADGTRDFSVRLHDCFQKALASHAKSIGGKMTLDLHAFFLATMLDALGHAVVLRRPPGISLHRAKAGMRKALFAYLKGNDGAVEYLGM